MPARRLAELRIELDERGDLVDPLTWTPEVGEVLAGAAGIAPLSSRHWTAITAFREEAARRGEAPSVERLGGLCGVPVDELFQLFAGRPDELIARIAGRRPARPSSQPRSSINETPQGGDS